MRTARREGEVEVTSNKSHLSHQHILSQLETAVLYSTHTMRQLEVIGCSPLLKLLVTDLWTLLWTVLFLYILCRRIAVSYSILSMRCYNSTYTMHKRLCQDEVQF